MSHHGFLTVVFLFMIFGGLSALTKNGTCWALPLFCPLEM